jgi:hypothetical protein
MSRRSGQARASLGRHVSELFIVLVRLAKIVELLPWAWAQQSKARLVA